MVRRNAWKGQVEGSRINNHNSRQKCTRGQCPNLEPASIFPRSPSTHSEATSHDKGQDDAEKYRALWEAVPLRHLKFGHWVRPRRQLPLKFFPAPAFTIPDIRLHLRAVFLADQCDVNVDTYNFLPRNCPPGNLLRRSPSCPSRVSVLAFPPGIERRERPPQGVLRKRKLRNTPAPAPGRKRGGRSRQPPLSPCGRGGAGNMSVTP